MGEKGKIIFIWHIIISIVNVERERWGWGKKLPFCDDHSDHGLGQDLLINAKTTGWTFDGGQITRPCRMLTARSCPLYVRQPLRGHLFLVHAGVSRGVRKRLCFHTMPVADTMTWCLSPPLRTEGPRPPDVSSSWKLSSPAVLPKVMFSCEGAARARWPLI